MVAMDMSEADYLPLSKLKQRYQDFLASKREEREEADLSRRYYHADHYTAAELKALDDRNQPPITYNRVQRKIDGIVGLVERLRQDPKAYPRTPKHEDGAEIATQVLNYALDAVAWKDISPEVARSLCIEAAAGVELSLEDAENGNKDVAMSLVDPKAFFYDPRSSQLDFSDARYMGVSKWVDLEQAQEMFPDKADLIEDLADSGGGVSDGLDYADREFSWINVNEKKIRLVEIWYKRKGQWLYCYFVGSTKLSEGVSPFRDSKGKTFCRYIMVSMAVDHDDDRYGFVRNLKGPQDEINARRSKGLHALNTRRIAVSTSVSDVEEIRREMARPDGVIIKNSGDEIEDLSNAEMFRGNLEMLQEAKAELESYGPNPQLMGEAAGAKSGRAIAMLQQAGIAELGPYIIAYRSWKIRVYRAVWDLIRTYWTGERWVRITDDDGLAQFIAVNRLEMSPMGPQIVNAIGTLDVDIIVDEGPDQVNSMADAFDTLVALAQQGAQVPPDIIIELSSLPSSIKKRILAKLEQAAQPDPVQQQAVQLDLAEKDAKVRKTQAETAKIAAEAQTAPMKTMAEARKTAVEADQAQMVTAQQMFVPPEPQAPGLMDGIA